MIPSFIQRQVPLAPHTTLRVGGSAEYFCEAHDTAALRAAVSWAREHSQPVTILGGGSNVLISDEGVRGLVIRMCDTRVTFEEGDVHVCVTAQAGVVLDALIADTVARSLWGLENLSAIPGTVGAVPVQNVGAYGVEAKDVVESVTVYDMASDEIRVLTNEACAFGYRDSYFKSAEGKKLVILAVTFLLTRAPNRKLSYKDLVEYFSNIAEPSLLEIRTGVTAIRSKKFPDWHTVGTAGSFFKNPHVSLVLYKELCIQFPGLPGFPDGNDVVKVSLGWILDHVLHMKGFRKGHVGLFEKQALVLIGYEGVTAKEIYAFSAEIIDAVKTKTGIVVSREVQVLG